MDECDGSMGGWSGWVRWVVWWVGVGWVDACLSKGMKAACSISSVHCSSIPPVRVFVKMVRWVDEYGSYTAW